MNFIKKYNNFLDTNNITNDISLVKGNIRNVRVHVLKRLQKSVKFIT